MFNPVASTIRKWWMFKLLRWMQNLCTSQHENMKFCMLIDIRNMKNSTTCTFATNKNTNTAGGWILKFALYFTEMIHKPLHLLLNRLSLEL
jgi:hypothetical protein